MAKGEWDYERSQPMSKTMSDRAREREAKQAPLGATGSVGPSCHVGKLVLPECGVRVESNNEISESLREAAKGLEEFAAKYGSEPVGRSTMRQQYRVLNDAEKAEVDLIKEQGEALFRTLSLLDASREISIAKTKLEEAVMWAVKGITK